MIDFIVNQDDLRRKLLLQSSKYAELYEKVVEELNLKLNGAFSYALSKLETSFTVVS